MTLRVWPVAVPLDPDARVLPAPLAATLAGGGVAAPVILLVAGPGAVARGWAPLAAVALAEAWSRDGLRTVLADLSLGAPALDRVVGEPNDEGLADVFFYGASLKRVIRSAATRGFGFIPAGLDPADPRDVLTHAAWRQVVTHFFREGAVLLVYVPADAPGLDSLAGRLGAVIALATPSDLAALEATIPADAAVLAVIEPPRPAEPPITAAVTPAEVAGHPEPARAEAVAQAREERHAQAEPAVAPEVEVASVPEPGADIEGTVVEASLEAAPIIVGRSQSQPEAAVEPEAAAAAVPVDAAEPRKRGGRTRAAAAEPPPAPAVEAEAVSEAEGAGAVAEASAAAGPAIAAQEPAPPPPPAAGVGRSAGRAASSTREPPLPPKGPHDALVEALWARRPGAQPTRPRVSPVDFVSGRKLTEAELLDEPPPISPEPPGRRWGLGLILWLILGAAVALGAVFGVQAYFGGRLPFVSRWLGRAPVSSAPAASAPGAGRTPGKVGTPSLAPRGAPDQGAPAGLADSLPYSVAIAAYPEYAVAVEQAASLAREQSSVGFFVTPLRHGTRIYYHVMAGPVADSVGATVLMRRLLDAGIKTGSSQFDIVQTRLAFNLGDYPSRSDAEDRAAELAPRNIPTYVVEVPTPGGRSRWRLYAGAFPGVADAATLRPTLRSAGLPDSLVTRIGRPGRP